MTRARRHLHEDALRAAALAYPETQEDFPWGHRVVKVRRKIFVVLSKDEPGLSVSVKLPWSAEGALQLPFCAPTGYGLGRAGWITATFGPRARPDLGMLCSWIDESYRAVAPKRLVAALPPTAPTGARRWPPRARRTPNDGDGDGDDAPTAPAPRPRRSSARRRARPSTARRCAPPR